MYYRNAVVEHELFFFIYPAVMYILKRPLLIMFIVLLLYTLLIEKNDFLNLKSQNKSHFLLLPSL